MIKFKVVDKNRRSCVVPQGSKFCLEYKRGKTVMALPDTIGIMVFEEYYYARTFISDNRKHDDWQILEVQAIGRRKKMPYKIATVVCDARRTTSIFKHFYKHYILGKSKLNDFMLAPMGSQCYKAVKVLQ